jgi:hypothetical protein
MANTITTFNISPYYDDFSDDKNFHRILFRPGLAVQARELTQLQTILQDQISKFGQHVFKEGSRVLDGQLFIRDKVRSVRLRTTFGGNTLSTTSGSNATNITLFQNSYVYGTKSDTKHKVIKAEIIDGTPHIFTSFISRGTANTYAYDIYNLANNEILRFNDAQTNAVIGYANTKVTGAVTPSLLVSVDSGIFFIKGHFVKSAPQTIVVSASNTTPNASVGFTYTENIVSSITDNTLLDPAQGAYNYAAPGADRYKITLNLSKVSDNLTANTIPSNYFELVRFQEGKPRTPFNDPKYASILDLMAKRTYDESGNYSVRPFRISLPQVFANTANVSLKISQGKAYVGGYVVDYLTPTSIQVPAARGKDSEVGYDIGTYYGNYIKVSGLLNGTFNLANTSQVQLHRTNKRGSIAAGTWIGNAHVSFFQYDTGTGNTAIHNLFLHNIQMKSGYEFSNVQSVILGNTSSVTAFANVVLDSTTGGIYANGSTKLFEPTYKKYLFKFPQPYISTVTSSEYETRRAFKNITFTNGKATLTTDSGNERFLGASSGSVPNPQRYYTVVIKSGGAAGPNNRFMNGKHVPLDVSPRYANVQVVSSGSPGQVIINLSNTTFNGVCDVVAGIDIENNAGGTPGRRTKTLVTGSNKTFVTVAANTYYSLQKSDLYKVSAILFTGNTSVNPKLNSNNVIDIINNFEIDNGQRDTHYDHARIRLRVGAAVPVGRINVVFDYFTHSGKGYFTTNSYPVVYSNIPTYKTGFGENVRLADVYDFRPRRTDNTSNTTLIFDAGVQMPDYSASINSDYSYYISRIDKLFLTKSGEFVYKTGSPSFYNPVPPQNIDGAMLLATIKFDPYTFNSSSISVQHENNRRYTMKDIGKIDSRLSRVEYYTSLNLLEKDVKSLDVKDSAGNDLFKNGILVDNFIGHSVGDVLNPQYRASVDFTARYARPMFTSNTVEFTTTSFSGTQKKSDFITLPYTEKVLYQNDFATRTENVNPFNVFNWTGTLKLTPDSDFWQDTDLSPIVEFNDQNAYDNWIAGLSSGTQWNGWEENWFGVSVCNFGGLNPQGISSYTQSTTSAAALQSTITKTASGGGNYGVVVRTNVLPYMRERLIKFDLTGMRPNTQLVCWFDSKIVNYRIRVGSSSAPLGNTVGNLVTDQYGRANGYIDIPASNDTSVHKFTTGNKLVIFCDSAIEPQLSTTSAQAIYAAQGVLNYVARGSVKGPDPTLPPTCPPFTPNPTRTRKPENSSTPTVSVTTTFSTLEPGPDDEDRPGSTSLFIDSTISDSGMASITGRTTAEVNSLVSKLEQWYVDYGIASHEGRVAGQSGTIVDAGGFAYWAEVIENYGEEAARASIQTIGEGYASGAYDTVSQAEKNAEYNQVTGLDQVQGNQWMDEPPGYLESFDVVVENVIDYSQYYNE